MDKHYEEKYSDMQNRMDSLYDEIAEANDFLETVQMQIQDIRERKFHKNGCLNLWNYLI